MNIWKILKDALKQIYSSRRLLIYIYTPIVILLLGLTLLASLVPDFKVRDILKDVAAIGELPFYSGAISQLGLLMWSAATSLCFFAFFALRKIDSSRKETLNFLLFAACLSGYLMLDDTYMLHEVFFPNYLTIIPSADKVVILLLGIAMLLFLYFNRSEILRNDYGILFLALMLFGFSVTLDVIPSYLYEETYALEKIEYILEDGAKFAAIVTWYAFFVQYCYQQFLLLKISQKPN
ncbi:MAG: hypothetical protein IPO22_21485 [Anaerolineales bacterium]|jgi:hypothetical protein|nr:hypothetical protein [Anaerolineales bacterium]